MNKIKVISLLVLVLSFLLQVLADVNHTDNSQLRVDTFSHPSESPHEESSFMSKIAGWIFPFSSTNEPESDPILTEANRRYDPQYLPPQKQCNPCNQEPWIPMASRQGHNTVIGFVPPPGHSSPPHNYGPPPLLSHQAAPSTQYGPPTQQYRPPATQYGFPTQQYGPPSSQYGPPTQQYRPQPSSQYGPPAQHGSAPSPQYGPPTQHGSSPSSKYGPPKQHDSSPPSQYGPPVQHGPPPSHQYGPPTQQYGPPAAHQHGPPTHQYGPPPLPQYDQQGYHSDVTPNVKPPPNNYQIPTYFIPPPPSKIKNNFKYSNRYKPPVKPNNQYKYHQTKPKLPPPSLHHGPPIPLNFGKTQSFETTQALSLEFKPPSVEPEIFKSYAPILTNYDIPLQVPQINSASPSYIDNFSSPVYTNANGPNPQVDFSQSQHNSFLLNSDYGNNQETVKSVQLIPSIRIADFVSSIEHPINVIQSPVVDVLATDNDISKEETTYEGTNLNQQPIVVEDAHVSATAHNATYLNLVHDQNRHNEQLHEIDQSLKQNSAFNLKSATEIPIVPSSLSPFSFDFNINSHSNHFLPTVQINHQNLPTSQSLVGDPNIKESWNIEAVKDVRTNEPFSSIPNFSTYDQHYTNNAVVVSTENPRVTLHIQKTSSTDKPQDFSFSSHINEEKASKFNPTINFGDWTANFGSLSTAMVPPSVNQPLWSTTKKPKHVQIIIPYKINDVKGVSASLPLYTQPPSVDKSPVWSNFPFDHSQEGSKQVTVTAKSPTESVLSLQEFVEQGKQKSEGGNEILRLQKNIDDWTVQEFSNTVANLQKSTSTIGKLIPSKKIPNEYLTTFPYSVTKESTTSKSVVRGFYDHKSSSSNRIEKKDVNSNLIAPGGTTPAPTTLTTTPPEVTNTNLASMIPILSTLPNWEKLQLSISPLTKEKIYVVTPQPWKFIIPKEINDKLLSPTEAPSLASNSKFAVVIKNGANQTMADRNGLKLIFSEWPHLINRLITTTTEEPKSTGHPLFGLMDLTPFTPTPNATVETYSGHSKVITLVTPASTSKNDKKTTIKST